MDAQHRFSQEELVTLMIKAAQIHQGFFVFMFDANIAIGGFKTPSHPDAARSGMIMTFDNFAIQQVEDGTPDAVDASKVNPA